MAGSMYFNGSEVPVIRVEGQRRPLRPGAVGVDEVQDLLLVVEIDVFVDTAFSHRLPKQGEEGALRIEAGSDFDGTYDGAFVHKIVPRSEPGNVAGQRKRVLQLRFQVSEPRRNAGVN